MDTPGVGAGAKLHICLTLPTAFTLATGGYDSLTYEEIVGVTTYTPSGKTFQETTSQPLAGRNPNVYKSVFDFGQHTFVADRDDSDDGQSDFTSAVDQLTEATFKVEYDDGSFDYFTGYAMAFTPGALSAAGMKTRNGTIRQTRAVTPKAAP